MQRTKTMLFTLIVVALVVPSLWAQKEESATKGMSIKQIKETLQARAQATGVAAICTGIAGGVAPAGYLAGTNKCSSSSSNYGFGQSLNVTVGACADKSGVDGTWGVGMDVDQAGVPGSVYTTWGSSFNVGGFENQFPVIYTPALRPSPDVVLTLNSNKKQSVFGLEVNNPTEENYKVSFATTAGPVSLPLTLVGGVGEPNNQAQRFIAVCNTPAITGVTISCQGCADNAATAVGQIRGDKFAGF